MDNLEPNFEMSFISILLNKPNLIQELDVQEDWFEMESMRIILKAIKQSNGTDVFITEIHQRIKEENIFTTVSLNELEMLADTNTNPELIWALLEQIHRSYG